MTEASQNQQGETKPRAPSQRVAKWRVPFLVLGILSLIGGIWGGLVRLSLNLPLPGDNANWITFHGPLMVSGFLGTVIGLERAVALRRGWTYLPPLFTAFGAIMLLAGSVGVTGSASIAIGSALFVGVTANLFFRHHHLFLGTMAVGAVLWLVGNILWVIGWPIYRIVLWWVGFLVLTILGERLELTRLQRPSKAAKPTFLVAVGVFVTAIIIGLFAQKTGEWLAGIGMLGMAAWLLRFDIARRTIKGTDLPRFIAVCLLSGYFWLASAGVLTLVAAPLMAGPVFDAALHALFLGFVFSMIFGHAPIIFPSVLNLPSIEFRNRFYVHVGLLHLSLFLRIGGDLLGVTWARQWGATLNAISIAVFLINTILSILSGLRRP